MNELACTDLEGGGLLLVLPVGMPIPKGNSKRIAIRKDTGSPFLVSSDDERRHERTVRAAVALVAAGRRVPGDVTLDLVSLYPVPELSSEHDAAWRARALAGDVAPGLGAHVGRRKVADRGNLAKLVEDACSPRPAKRGVERALAGTVIDDDACIVDGDVAKAWARPEDAGYIVRVRPWRKRARWWADPEAQPLAHVMDRIDELDTALLAARASATDELLGERVALKGLGGAVTGDERRIVVEVTRGRLDDATASLVRLGWIPDGPAGRTATTERGRFRRPA